MNDPISILLRSACHHFLGRLGSDPQIKYLEGGNCVANVNIAITQLADRNLTDWIKLEVWGESGQAFADQCRKGQQVSVAGRVKTDRWTDRQTGEERMQLLCRVEQWRVIETPAIAPAQQAQQAPTPVPAPAPAPAPALAPAPVAQQQPAPPAAPGWGGTAPAAAQTAAWTPQQQAYVQPPAQPAAQPPVWQSSEEPPF